MSKVSLWEDPEIVDYYTYPTELQPPEITIFNILRDQLSEMRMLDIGVGAGRTSLHFINSVKEYVGIDYSEQMILRCTNRFSSEAGNFVFQVCDVRSMSRFQDNEFDLVLFSFNGLDCLSHNDRLDALREIRRVTRPGGFFCFSTHNLQYIRKLFGLKHQLTWRPRTLLKRLNHWMHLNFVHNNPLQILKHTNSQFAIINDGAHGYRLQMYYIMLSEQIEQLSGYFENIRIFLGDGSEFSDWQRIDQVDDWWVYFLCNVKEKARV